jgi:hypothetical protein
MFLGFPDPDSLVSGTDLDQAKLVRKPLIPTVL